MEKAKELRKDGIVITKINADNISDLVKSSKMKQEPKALVLSDVQKAILQENYKDYQELHDKNQVLDFSIFKDGADPEQYMKRVVVAKQLLVMGYNNIQVREMGLLINKGLTKEEISSILPVSISKKEIAIFISQMS